MLSLRRSSGMLGLAVAAITAVGLQAAPALASHVGPKQYFTGVINGKAGNTTVPIPIKMACAAPNGTGHPVKGQTLAVHQLFPPAGGSVGYTGKDSRIGVFFDAPPPAGAKLATSPPVFTRYDKPQPLPTSVTLPCSGTGTVYFAPLPVVPPAQVAAVPVKFLPGP
jgi:hypothetical protein